MVWNRRHVPTITPKCFANSQVAPYLLHVGMVAAVAIYVFAGAMAIRAIEAAPKTPGPDLSAVSKSERYWMSRNSSKQSEELPVKTVVYQANATLENREHMARSRRCVITALKKITLATKCRQDQVKDSLMAQLDRCYHKDVRNIIKRAMQEGKAIGDASGEAGSDPESIEWTYWPMTDAILFCFTVITTIGYGNVAPQTVGGQVFVIIYGLFGVPFSMVVIANFGKFLAEMLRKWFRPFKILARKMWRKLRQPGLSPRDKEKLMFGEAGKKKVSFAVETTDPENNNVPTEGIEEAEDMEEAVSDAPASTHKDAAALFIAFVLYVIFGSLIIASYEPDMDVFKAIYYIFVSLTTIGLGDVVPKSKSYLLFTLIYIAIGLALTTIAIEIASDYLKQLHYFGRKMENVGNVQIWFGGKKLTMKQLVKNLGDQFNLPIDDLADLNLDKFVDDAIKVEAGEIPTLRSTDYPYGIKPIFITDFKDALREGSVIFADEDERYIVYGFPREHYARILPPALLPEGRIPNIDGNDADDGDESDPFTTRSYNDHPNHPNSKAS